MQGRDKRKAAPVSARALVTGIACAFCIALYNEVPREFLNQYPIIVLQAWAFLIGGAAFYLVFHPWTYHYVPNAVGYFGIAFVVIVGNIMAFTVYMTGVALIGPGKGVLYGFSEPVTAAVITFIFFGSPFTIYDAVGFAAVFAMLVLISVQNGQADREGG